MSIDASSPDAAASDASELPDAFSPGDAGVTDAGSFAWTNCDAFLDGAGSAGDACDPTSFGTCSDGMGCCDTYSCDPATQQVTVMPPLCDGPCLLRAGCSGFTPPPPPARTCRSDGDCSGLQTCQGPGDPPPPCCGICRMGIHNCASTSDCAPGDVCQTVDRVCSCDGPDMFCVPDCRTGSDCTVGMICDPDTGVCRAPNCTDGIACPASATCEPGASGADESGCVRRSCTSDSDCDCGACVNGSCHDGVGTCVELVFCD